MWFFFLKVPILIIRIALLKYIFSVNFLFKTIMQKVYIEQQELIFILSCSVFIWMTKIITKVENSADVIPSDVTNHKKKKVR